MNNTRRQKELITKLIQMFDLVLNDSQDMWILNYCKTEEDKRQRILDDEKFRNEFLSFLKELVK